MTAGVILDRTLKQSGCLALFTGSRADLERALREQLKEHDAERWRLFKSRAVGAVSKAIFLRQGQAEADSVARNALYGIQSVLEKME